MANQWTNPYKLDTAGANLKTGYLRVKGLGFRGYSTAGHKAVVKDVNGTIVAELVGTAALTPIEQSFSEPIFINGFTLSGATGSQAALSSGELIVYIC